jgi:hypothetical protein
MSELYHHLLIPKDPAFVPQLSRVNQFFIALGSLGVLPDESKVRAITQTGKTRIIGRSPKTGEVYYGPELSIRRFTAIQPAVDILAGEEFFDLISEAIGPTTVPPFELYGAHRPDVRWKGAYPFSVQCRQRERTTHFLHSSFGCKCEIRPDEPGVFENPWNDREIRTSGFACARFWVDIGIGSYLMPMITDSIGILDARIVSATNSVFGVDFTQGCWCNDD